MYLQVLLAEYQLDCPAGVELQYDARWLLHSFGVVRVSVTYGQTLAAFRDVSNE